MKGRSITQAKLLKPLLELFILYSKFLFLKIFLSMEGWPWWAVSFYPFFVILMNQIKDIICLRDSSK
jgi:hypothetical protein